MLFSNVNVFMRSYFEPNFIEKFILESVFFFCSFFEILAKIEMTQNKS